MQIYTRIIIVNGKIYWLHMKRTGASCVNCGLQFAIVTTFANRTYTWGLFDFIFWIPWSVVYCKFKVLCAKPGDKWCSLILRKRIMWSQLIWDFQIFSLRNRLYVSFNSQRLLHSHSHMYLTWLEWLGVYFLVLIKYKN